MSAFGGKADIAMRERRSEFKAVDQTARSVPERVDVEIRKH